MQDFLVILAVEDVELPGRKPTDPQTVLSKVSIWDVNRKRLLEVWQTPAALKEAGFVPDMAVEFTDAERVEIETGGTLGGKVKIKQIRTA